ncbi:hypothetical protein BGZ65_006877 [Modicella reniformis]|uniref:Ricin B lectin domain-containing protein n=1 Tax=Modicella reniformis TaxID=1440133 RepID=A0A9P6MKK1_9FUNG|nr:hypothetical protein BGZ65_006877 [Modicella reniformis]
MSVSQTALRIKNVRNKTMLYDNKDKGLIPWQESTNADGYWYITPVTDRYYKIKNRLSGNCIYYNIEHKKPIAWQDSANEDGKWEIIPQAEAGKFKIRNVLSPGMYLYHNIDNGLIGYPDSNGEDGLWTFEA